MSVYLEALQNKHTHSTIPPHLPFYVRSSDAETKGTFKLVEVPLGRNRDPKKFLKSILKICNLSTDFVDQIKTVEPSASIVNPLDSDAPISYRYSNGQWTMNDREGFDESIILGRKYAREEVKLS